MFTCCHKLYRTAQNICNIYKNCCRVQKAKHDKKITDLPIKLKREEVILEGYVNTPVYPHKNKKHQNMDAVKCALYIQVGVWAK